MMEDYFYQRQIDADAVMQHICDRLPNFVFVSNRSVFYTLTVPAVSGNEKYALFTFPGVSNPRHFVNGKESKTDDVEVLYGDPIVPVQVSSVETTPYFVFCRHGNGYLVDRSSLESTIYMKMTMVERSENYLMDDVRLAMRNVYYNLLVRNIENLYSSMNLFSDAIANHSNSNQRVLPLIAHDIEEEESYLL